MLNAMSRERKNYGVPQTRIFSIRILKTKVTIYQHGTDQNKGN